MKNLSTCIQCSVNKVFHNAYFVILCSIFEAFLAMSFDFRLVMCCIYFYSNMYLVFVVLCINFLL